MDVFIDQLDGLCRICVAKSSNMRNLFEKVENGETLANKIFACTQVNLGHQFDRPSSICNTCANQLEYSYSFYKLVENSEKNFQKILSSAVHVMKINAVKSNPLEMVEVKMEMDQGSNFSEQTDARFILFDPSISGPEINEDHHPPPPEEKSIINLDPMKEKTKRLAKKKAKAYKKRDKENKTKDYECYKCKEKFSSLWKTSVHLKQHDAEEKFKCMVCSSRFVLWDEFSRHLCQGSSIQCSYCSETFFATVALLEHLEHSHDEKTLFKCERCARFYSMSLLKQYHMIQHVDIETEDTKPYACKVCKKRFATKMSIRNHEEIHSDKKPFLCFECGKSFKTSSSLHTHRKGHSEKTMKCPDCPMTFNRIAGLRKHRDVHLNLKYKCNLCHTELKSKDALERHTRRHRLTDDDKKHRCTFCPMKFFKKDKLTRHIRTHTGEKPFKCEFCSDRAYAQKGDLTKHIKQKHVGNNIYSCEICKEGFQYFADLKTHSFEHYKEEKAKQESILS